MNYKKNKVLKYLLSPLENFKWYRKKVGGEWYLIILDDDLGGFTSPIEMWVNYKPNEDCCKILKAENHNRECANGRGASE